MKVSLSFGFSAFSSGTWGDSINVPRTSHLDRARNEASGRSRHPKGYGTLDVQRNEGHGQMAGVKEDGILTHVFFFHHPMETGPSWDNQLQQRQP